MSLKCPFCGKEYYHDRKMCQTCEDKARKSTNVPENYTYIHYERTTAFGRKKPDELYIQIASEPKFSDFHQKLDYNWNCNPRFRLRNYYILKSELSKLRSIKKLETKDSKVLEEKNLA